MISVGVIGYGYWGPNIARNISRHPGLLLAGISDIARPVLTEAKRLYPTVSISPDPNTLIQNPAIDALFIVTPVSTHAPLAAQALTNGKHVLVEKPLTGSSDDARVLAALSKKRGRICMVDHTFVYTPAVSIIKTLIDSGELGDIYAVDSVRTNLGILRTDSNVMQDLAVHDFSIMDYLFGAIPKTISATGISDKTIKQETVAYISARYPTDLFLHAHVSWLSPIKIRRMIFTGTKKMLVYDDMEPTEKIKIYDKGVSVVKDSAKSKQLRIGYRNGDIMIPTIPMEEALWGVISEFEESIRVNRTPRTDASQGLRVIRCIEAATASIRTGGGAIRV